MFKARGILWLDLSRTVHEIQFKDGELTGDLPLVTAIKVIAEEYATNGHHFYSYVPPVEDYTKDGLAVVFMMQDVCDKGSVVFEGDVPDLPYEDGLIY